MNRRKTILSLVLIWGVAVAGGVTTGAGIHGLLVTPVTPLIEQNDKSAVEWQELKATWEQYLRQKYTAADPQPDSETEWCEFIAEAYGATTEHELFDGSRVDLLTTHYAIEADWADKSLKWAEGIGQCLWYADVTGKKPCLFLLVPISPNVHWRDPLHIASQRVAIRSNIYKATAVCTKRGIRLEVIELWKIKGE